MALRQRLSFAVAWQRLIVQLGALSSDDVIFLCLKSQRPLEKRTFWAVMQRHRWQTCREAGSWGEGMRKGVNFGPENQSSIRCQVLGNDYTIASLPLSFSFLCTSGKSQCHDSCPTAWIVPANSLIRWHDRPHTLGLIVNVSMCMLLRCVQSSEKNKWPCNETRCNMTHPLFPIWKWGLLEERHWINKICFVFYPPAAATLPLDNLGVAAAKTQPRTKLTKRSERQ